MFQLGNIGRHSVRVERLAIIKAWLFFARSQRSSADPKTQKTKKNLSLPRLQGPEETTGAGGEHSAECECCHDVAVRREKRHQRLKPWSEATPVSEMITETVVESPGKARFVFKFVRQPEITYLTVASSENNRWFSCSYVAFIATESLCNNYIHMIFSSYFFYFLRLFVRC